MKKYQYISWLCFYFNLKNICDDGEITFLTQLNFFSERILTNRTLENSRDITEDVEKKVYLFNHINPDPTCPQTPKPQPQNTGLRPLASLTPKTQLHSLRSGGG